MSQTKDRKAKAQHLAVRNYGYDLVMPLKGLDELDRLEGVAAHALEHHRPGAPGLYNDLSELLETYDGSLIAHISPSDAFTYPLSGFVPPPMLVRGRARANALALAIKNSEDSHADALVRAGVGAETVKIMRSWLETVTVGSLLQSELQATRIAMLSQADHSWPDGYRLDDRDPSETLGVAEFSKLLGVSSETVRRRESEGKVISFLGPHRKRGRAYPVFQTWKGIAGEPLEDILSHLPDKGAAAFAFFTGINDLLGGLTPVEALLGELTSARDVGVAQRFLEQDGSVRRAAVVAAAGVFSQY
ncbi:hypothetical protein ABQW67_05480 [Xanthomonas hortorum]|uniref:hypothetical protein n=1 Tax=Xanthomonas hortorum TaxID=56454 RepID=UPI0032E90842